MHTYFILKLVIVSRSGMQGVGNGEAFKKATETQHFTLFTCYY